MQTHTTPNTPSPPHALEHITQQHAQRVLLVADDIGVSASDLADMIRRGNGGDLNELVRRTLCDRNAA